MKNILRLRLVIASLLMLFTLESVASDHAASNYTIGLAVWSGYPECVQGFKDALANKGLNAGKNLTYLQGEVGANKSLQAQVAQQFSAKNVDLVFSLTTPGTTIMKNIMADTTPIVFSIVTYPADSGLIESFEYSGNNLVGTSNYVPLSHSIKLLLAVRPETKTVAIFHREGEPNSKIQTANLYRFFKKKKIKVIDVEANSILDLTSKALALVSQADAFITTTDTLMQSGGEQALIKLSLAHKIPILSSNKKGIEQGSTFGVVADFYQLGNIAGNMAANILLNKVLPEALQSKLQQPPTYLFNKHSMQQLGITVPAHVDFTIQWTQ